MCADDQLDALFDEIDELLLDGRFDDVDRRLHRFFSLYANFRRLIVTELKTLHTVLGPATASVLEALDRVRRCSGFPPAAVEFHPKWNAMFLRRLPGATSAYAMQYLPLDSWSRSDDVRTLYVLDERLCDIPGFQIAHLERLSPADAVSLTITVERADKSGDFFAGSIQIVSEGEQSLPRLKQAGFPLLGQVDGFDVYGGCLVASSFAHNYTVVPKQR